MTYTFFIMALIYVVTFCKQPFSLRLSINLISVHYWFIIEKGFTIIYRLEHRSLKTVAKNNVFTPVMKISNNNFHQYNSNKWFCPIHFLTNTKWAQKKVIKDK